MESLFRNGSKAVRMVREETTPSTGILLYGRKTAARVNRIRERREPCNYYSWLS